MKINQSVEQGIYVALMLALQKDHTSVKSSVLSGILQVSDSYMKKILRKMVVAGIITSGAGKEGGFQLARSVDEITVNDIYQAVDGGGTGIHISGIAHHIFVDDEKLSRNESAVLSLFERASAAYEDELKKMRLSELLIKENYQNGWTDWADRFTLS